MSTDTFKVSIVIPVFNAEAYVATSVKSALYQNEVREVILVEDGSPDGSLAICRELAATEERVLLLQHADGRNHGAGASRNLGLAHASSPYIAFLDADDYYLPNRFAGTRQAFDAHADADGVYEAIGATFEDEAARETFERSGIPELTTVHRNYLSREELFGSISGRGDWLGHFSLVGLTLKRDTLVKMDALFRPELRVHQDTEFNIRLAWYCRLVPGQISVPVAMRRLHRQNRSTAVLGDKRKLARSRASMYTVLATWAGEEVQDMALHRYFQGMYAWYRLQQLRGPAMWFYAAGQVLASPAILRQEKVQYPFFRELGSRGKIDRLVAKVLEAFLIRIY